MNQRIALIDIVRVCTRPKATLAQLLYLMLSPTFCFSFSAPCKHWCNNEFHYTEERRRVSLVAPLHLNNRSTAVFKKLITFLAVAKVSRDAPRCNIGRLRSAANLDGDEEELPLMSTACKWFVCVYRTRGWPCLTPRRRCRHHSVAEAGNSRWKWAREGRADPATALHSLYSLFPLPV